MKLLSSLLLLLLLLLFSSCNGQAKIQSQETVNKLQTTASGDPRLIKSQGTNQYAAVSRGLQDKAGSLWFCAPGEGIYRYDGKSFTNFTKQDGLTSNDVWCVLEDNTGKLWFGTGNGICIYDPLATLGGSVTFTSIQISVPNESNLFAYNSQGSSPSARNEVWSILQDKTGKFWFGTTDGAYRYDGKIFTHFLHDDGIINNTGFQFKKIEHIIEDKAGNIWLGGRTTEGVFRFDGKDLTAFTPHSEDWLWPLLADKAGNIWFNTRNHGTCRYDGKTFIKFGAKEILGWVSTMAEDTTGRLWFASGNGLVGYDGEAFTHFTTKDGLSNNDVFSVTLDRSGNIWLGAREMSLFRYDGKTFTDFSDKGSHDIRRIFEDHAGNLWFGINGDGVRRYDPSAAKGTVASLTYFSIKDGLGSKDVRCIGEDKAGNLWFGTDSGLSKFDGKHFINFTVKDGLPCNDVWSLLIDKAGTVWVGTREGACRFSLSVPTGANVFTNFAIPAAEENDFSRSVSGTKVIWDIKEDNAGNIWFATNGAGACRYDGKSLINISTKDGLCNNFVNCILPDKKGNIWFATQYGGVSCYRPSIPSGPNSMRFTNFTEQDGMCSSEVWTMSEDKAGNIWFSGKGCGVDCYNGKIFKNFSTNSEAIRTMVRNYVQSIFHDRKDSLWVGCSGGLYHFDGKSFINLTRGWALGVL